MKTLELEDGTKLSYENDIIIITKSADSYYRNSIPNQYKQGMHDTRGIQMVCRTEEEALNKLFEWAGDCRCDNSFIDDNYIAELKEESNDIDLSWYDGEGIYNDNNLQFKYGETKLEDDLRYYNITTFEQEMENNDDDDIISLANAINDSYYDVIKIEYS